MAGLDVGISGLDAARKALDVIGNNIANAGTDGYHRQDVQFKSRDDMYVGGLYIGQGVDFGEVVRRYDKVLETQMSSEESMISEYSTELDSLDIVETAFGDLVSGASGLDKVMAQYFAAMHDLSVDPTSMAYQGGAITSAESLAFRFNSLGKSVYDVNENLYAEAISTVEKINSLGYQIAHLNDSVYQAAVKGDDANNILDQRDRLITDLQRLAGVSVTSREFSLVDVVVGDMPLVLGTQVSELEFKLVDGGGVSDFGLSPLGAIQTYTEIDGGKLGGLFNLRNNIIKDIRSDLDTLALTVANETNKLHVQGVGTAGSFTSLTSNTLLTANVSDLVPAVTNGGVIEMRVIDGSGTPVVRSITVNTTDTLTTLAAKITAADANITGSVSGNQLAISASGAYTFDFVPVSPSTDSDTSGFLAAAGLNTFFSGTTAATMRVNTFVSNAADGRMHIASSGTTSLTDNANILAMAKLGDTVITGLGGLSPKDYYIKISNDLGNKISSIAIKNDNSKAVLNSLRQQRSESSGVDMNIEATKMLTYEQMFQAMAKYINTISETMRTVMEISM
jgi:flagellar hook-associated protein 1 FlgK